MDSRKFKKADNNTPKNKKRKHKKHKKRNYNIKQDNYRHNKNQNNKIKHYKKEEIQNIKPLKHKKETKINYRNILILCAVLFAIIFMLVFTNSLIQKSNIPEDAELIKPVGFNLTPYGYEWNNKLYGEAVVTDENDTNSTYYFSLNQMAALASASDNTFNYTNGIYVTYNTSRNRKIVTNIYSLNGKEIIKPDDFDEYDFLTNSRFLGRESPYCLEGFGFTAEEYKNSIF